jgi:hypothetical protein
VQILLNRINKWFKNISSKNFTVKQITIAILVVIIPFFLILGFFAKVGLTVEFQSNFIEYNDQHDWIWSFILSVVSIALVIISTLIMVITAYYLWKSSEQTRETIDDKFASILEIKLKPTSQEKGLRVTIENAGKEYQKIYKSFLPPNLYFDKFKQIIRADFDFILEIKNMKQSDSKSISFEVSHKFKNDKEYTNIFKEDFDFLPGKTENLINITVPLDKFLNEKLIQINKNNAQGQASYEKIMQISDGLSQENFEIILLKHQLSEYILDDEIKVRMTYYDLKENEYKIEKVFIISQNGKTGKGYFEQPLWQFFRKIYILSKIIDGTPKTIIEFPPKSKYSGE